MEEKLKQIINHYGIMPQLKYIHSEYFELDEAIFEYETSGWDFRDEECENIERKYATHIAEELADVMVMLKQFQYYYDIEDEQIQNIMNFKINRQLDRIANENIDMIRQENLTKTEMKVELKGNDWLSNGDR